MGMFDTIRCSYDLGSGFWHKELQTKDLWCACDEYWLAPNGQLFQIDYSGTQAFVNDGRGTWTKTAVHGRVRATNITRQIEVYPARWDCHYAPYSRRVITFVEGQLFLIEPCLEPRKH